MKLIDKILKRFGYVKESQVSQDLDFILDLFGIKSVNDVRIQSQAFSELSKAVCVSPVLKAGMKEMAVKFRDGNATTLQDKIDDIMVREGLAGQFEELDKPTRQKIFAEAWGVTQRTRIEE